MMPFLITTKDRVSELLLFELPTMNREMVMRQLEDDFQKEYKRLKRSIETQSGQTLTTLQHFGAREQAKYNVGLMTVDEEKIFLDGMLSPSKRKIRVRKLNP